MVALCLTSITSRRSLPFILFFAASCTPFATQFITQRGTQAARTKPRWHWQPYNSIPSSANVSNPPPSIYPTSVSFTYQAVKTFSKVSRNLQLPLSRHFLRRMNDYHRFPNPTHPHHRHQQQQFHQLPPPPPQLPLCLPGGMQIFFRIFMGPWKSSLSLLTQITRSTM